MKKNTLVLFALVLFVALLSSCGLFVTPVAYTRFEPVGDQYVYYDSYEYIHQVQVFKDEDEFKKDPAFRITDLEFNFTDCYGRDEINGDYYTVVSLKHKSVNLTVNIDKSSPNYSASKNLYLNGSLLVPDDTYVTENVEILTFYNLQKKLVRTNSKGHLDPEAVNVIEYR